ncbi:MAG: EFR1 family ferrodoxin [Spirochaetes bacterium]|nr:EFR1 family ferrodoxin [Spirochaetota bacterium]
MKIRIIYFSGTGNTTFITDKLMAALRDKAGDIRAIPVEEAISRIDALETGAETILGVAYPVYDLSAPEIIDRFIELLPISRAPVPVFIYSTQALIRLDCNAVTSKKLREKNYLTIAKEGFKLPSNGLSFYGDAGHVAYRYATRFEYSTDIKIVKFSNRIIRQYARFRNKPFSLNPYTFRAVNVVRGYSLRLVGEKLYRNLQVDTRCVRCGICSALCPEKNIVITREGVMLKEDNHCLRCLRCVYSCPSKSINFTSSARSGNYTSAIRQQRYVQSIIKTN